MKSLSHGPAIIIIREKAVMKRGKVNILLKKKKLGVDVGKKTHTSKTPKKNQSIKRKVLMYASTKISSGIFEVGRATNKDDFKYFFFIYFYLLP